MFALVQYRPFVHNGAYAEYASVPEQQLAHMPGEACLGLVLPSFQCDTRLGASMLLLGPLTPPHPPTTHPPTDLVSAPVHAQRG